MQLNKEMFPSSSRFPEAECNSLELQIHRCFDKTCQFKYFKKTKGELCSD